MAKSPERIHKKKKKKPNEANDQLVSNSYDHANSNYEIANDILVSSEVVLSDTSPVSDFIKGVPYIPAKGVLDDGYDDTGVDFTDRMVGVCDISFYDEKEDQRAAVKSTVTKVGDFNRDLPKSITEIIFGSPALVSRKPARHLDEYFNLYRQVISNADADFNKSQVIFCGNNHRGLAFYELVKDLNKKGKKIRAVFMEEINSDAQAKEGSQNIIDRHFVENAKEKKQLKFALSIDELHRDVVIDHLVKESSNYLDGYLGHLGVGDRDQQEYLRNYYTDFLNELKSNNIAIGGVDHSLYRAQGGCGYDCNRHAYMNFHAAMIVKSYIERLNLERMPLAADEVVLVSIGNAHGINRYNEIEMSDGNHIAIPSVQTIFKTECENSCMLVPASSISFVDDSDIVEKDGYDTATTIIHKNKYSNYSLYSERSDKSPSNAKYTSQYLAIDKTNHELDRRIGEFADLIVGQCKARSFVESTSFKVKSSSSLER